MIDSITRLNKVDLTDHGFMFLETITVKLDPDLLRTFVQTFKPIIANGLCGQTDTLSVLKDGRSFHVVYSDNDGKPLGDVEITKADCAT
jgi:hypothetical protein